VAQFFHRIRDAFIPLELRHATDALTQANRVVAFHLAMLLWVPVFSLFYLFVGAPHASNAVLFGGVIAIGSLVLLRRTKSLTLSSNLLCGGAWYVYTAIGMWTGGAKAPVMIWYVTLPVLSVLLVGYRSGLFWTITSLLTVSAFNMVRFLGCEYPNELSAFFLPLTEYIGLIGMLLCVSILVCVLKNMEHIARSELHAANTQLESLASLDALTGIANRRAFDLALQREWKRHARSQTPLSVAIVDADHFKQYNDTLGHLAGDECLRLIAEIIQSGICRAGDLGARYGGEEFALIFSETDAEAALYLADAIRSRVSALEIPHPNSSVSHHITISIGVATIVPGSDDRYHDLLHEADRALYAAKRAGRNQTIHGTVISNPGELLNYIEAMR
jgi:diguanylate cyclase (GGDEF)-like protein